MEDEKLLKAWECCVGINKDGCYACPMMDDKCDEGIIDFTSVPMFLAWEVRDKLTKCAERRILQ